MIVESARESDAGRVHALMCELEARDLPADRVSAILRAQLAQAAADPASRRVLVARDEPGGPALGIVDLRMDEQLHHAARVATILELVVESGSRGRGVGRELFRAAVAAAREAGCVQVELETADHRTGAHRFYEREGMGCDHRYYTMPLA